MPVELIAPPTGAYTTNLPWYTWNQNWTTTTSTTTNVWVDWNSPWMTNTTTMGTNSGVWVQWVNPVPGHSPYDLERGADDHLWAVQAQQRAAQIQQRTEAEWTVIREENERKRVERDALQVAARVEAHKLLAFVLTPEQMASYATHKYFDVIGSEGGLFRVHHGTSGNVRQLVNGLEINRLCVHPRMYDEVKGGHLPTEDCLAAQALALMHDELGVVTVANVQAGQRHLRAVA